MKKVLLHFALVVVFMLSSCGGDPVKVIRVPEAENIQLSLEGEIDGLLAPRAMSVADGHLVVYEGLNIHFWFSIFLSTGSITEPLQEAAVRVR